MNRQLARLLLSSYPSKWRAQYGSELEELLCGRVFKIPDIFNVLWSGFGERIRQPFAGFCFYSLLGSAFTFLTCLIFARSLWRTLAAPVTAVLREQGARPTAMITVRPWEAFEVIWLGIPALITVFVALALMLALTWIFFSPVMKFQRRQWAARFVLSSGTVFVLSSVLSFIAWQNGSLAKLLDLYPDVQNAPLLSVSHCFVLLAVSTIGVALLLQIPIVIFFAWRFRAMQACISSKNA